MSRGADTSVKALDREAAFAAVDGHDAVPVPVPAMLLSGKPQF
jgi:hypothetical protein